VASCTDLGLVVVTLAGRREHFDDDEGIGRGLGRSPRRSARAGVRCAARRRGSLRTWPIGVGAASYARADPSTRATLDSSSRAARSRAPVGGALNQPGPLLRPGHTVLRPIRPRSRTAPQRPARRATATPRPNPGRVNDRCPTTRTRR
jgi:hypothetical protein